MVIRAARRKPWFGDRLVLKVFGNARAGSSASSKVLAKRWPTALPIFRRSGCHFDALLECAGPPHGTAVCEMDYHRDGGGRAGDLCGTVQDADRVLEELGDAVSTRRGCDPG